jgi:hypothetical protein
MLREQQPENAEAKGGGKVSEPTAEERAESLFQPWAQGVYYVSPSVAEVAEAIRAAPRRSAARMRERAAVAVETADVAVGLAEPPHSAVSSARNQLAVAVRGLPLAGEEWEAK